MVLCQLIIYILIKVNIMDSKTRKTPDLHLLPRTLSLFCGKFAIFGLRLIEVLLIVNNHLCTLCKIMEKCYSVSNNNNPSI